VSASLVACGARADARSQCQKAVGRRQTYSWRLLLHGKPWKKVLPLSLYRSSSPDAISFAHFPVHSTAGVRGTITRYVTTIQTPSTIYHFYELDVAALDQDWLESNERTREWVDYAEAVRRLEWKPELAQGLRMCSLAR
jgi:diphosphoinositol-polyphosphate diphosphatase